MQFNASKEETKYYQNLASAERSIKYTNNLSMKLQAVNLNPLQQSLLDIAIKAGVFLVLLLLNFISAALSNGTFQLPDAVLTLPILTLLVSQLDSYFVQYANKENVPVPTV